MEVPRLHTPYLSHCFAPIEQYQTVAKRGVYTDVYALAATLYFLVTKNLPEPSISRVSGLMLHSPRSLNPSLRVRVNDAILKGMELEAENRPQTMGEWLKLLKEPVIPQTPIPQTPIPQASTPIPVTPQTPRKQTPIPKTATNPSANPVYSSKVGNNQVNKQLKNNSRVNNQPVNNKQINKQTNTN